LNELDKVLMQLKKSGSKETSFLYLFVASAFMRVQCVALAKFVDESYRKTSV
jgi:hypothetical protein